MRERQSPPQEAPRMPQRQNRAVKERQERHRQQIHAAHQSFFKSSLSRRRRLNRRYTTPAIMLKSTMFATKLPIFTEPMADDCKLPDEPKMSTIRGLMMSEEKDITTFETPVPRIKPSANPMTPCSRIKVKKPSAARCGAAKNIGLGPGGTSSMALVYNFSSPHLSPR